MDYGDHGLYEYVRYRPEESEWMLSVKLPEKEGSTRVSNNERVAGCDLVPCLPPRSALTCTRPVP